MRRIEGFDHALSLLNTVTKRLRMHAQLHMKLLQCTACCSLRSLCDMYINQSALYSVQTLSETSGQALSLNIFPLTCAHVTYEFTVQHTCSSRSSLLKAANLSGVWSAYQSTDCRLQHLAHAVEVCRRCCCQDSFACPPMSFQQQVLCPICINAHSDLHSWHQFQHANGLSMLPCKYCSSMSLQPAITSPSC